MRNRLTVLAFTGSLGAAIVPSGLHAQSPSSSSAEGQAAAQVVTNLQVQPLADLQFGAIVVGVGEGGEVVVGNAAADFSYRGSARSGCGQGGACAPHPAMFQVNGEASRAYRITIAGPVLARGQASGVALEVSALTLFSANISGSDGLGRLNADGADQFTVGGTLLVPAATTPDIFRADLPVTVSYE